MCQTTTTTSTTTTTVPPQRKEGSGQAGAQTGSPGCKNGAGEYDLIPVLKQKGAQIGYTGQENWYYKNNDGKDLLLHSQHSITVGPLCCSDCCVSECSKMDPRFLCGKPIIYDGTGKPSEVEGALRACRPVVKEIDEKKCKPGQLACLGGLMITGPAGQAPAAQQPAQAPAAKTCMCTATCSRTGNEVGTDSGNCCKQGENDCTEFCRGAGFFTTLTGFCPSGEEIIRPKGTCTGNVCGRAAAQPPAANMCECSGRCSIAGNEVGTDSKVCCNTAEQKNGDCTELCRKMGLFNTVKGFCPSGEELLDSKGTCTGGDCSGAGGYVTQSQAGTENQLPVEAQSGVGQAVGAYSGKTSIAGALVAGIILIAGLIVVAVLIANRPGKPISGTKLQTQIDSHVAVLRKLEETIGNIEKRRKP